MYAFKPFDGQSDFFFNSIIFLMAPLAAGGGGVANADDVKAASRFLIFLHGLQLIVFSCKNMLGTRCSTDGEAPEGEEAMAAGNEAGDNDADE